MHTVPTKERQGKSKNVKKIITLYKCQDFFFQIVPDCADLMVKGSVSDSAVAKTVTPQTHFTLSL